MRTWWLKLGSWTLFAITTGCRTMGPEIKPPKTPEVLAMPPTGDARYDTPALPKEAYANTYDPTKKAGAGQGLPARAGSGMGGPSMARGN